MPSQEPPIQSPVPGFSAGQPASPGKKSRRGLAIVIVLGIFIGFLAGFGALSYLVVKKVESAYASFKAGMTGTEPEAARPPAKPMAKNQPCPVVEPEKLAELRKGEANAQIPLIPGLVLEHIWVYYNADIEDLTRVPTVNDQEVQFTMSGPAAHAENGKAIVGPSVVAPGYPQCQADLLSSHLLVPEFNPSFAVPLVGVTRIGVSREVYESLKSGRKTPLEYRSHYGPVGNGYSWGYDYNGEIQRDISGPYSYKTIVNGTLTDLPALHAMGQLDGNPVQLAVLDDPGNPLLLDIEAPTWQFALRLAKVEYPAAKKIESELQNHGRAEVYGIYFDFDSAAIRAESESVLAEIAEALQQNPDWKLSIEGHTDNIGGDAHNLELSQRRAEAVKKALVARYSISADRLSTAGFGASRPKATNDTIEGRALNRRVELVKQ